MQDFFKQHGVFSWNELITTDLEAAKKFYGTLFGWTFQEEKTVCGGIYLIALKGEAMVGGMLLKEGNVPDDVPTCWDQYVTVDDVDASTRQVEDLGGEIMLPPTDIPNVGRFSVIQDPQGAVLSIITYHENV